MERFGNGRFRIEWGCLPRSSSHRSGACRSYNTVPAQNRGHR